ncbi:MAG TPA: DUF924 family protein [Burkholderiales bacterium]|nr:DUF924 family protein [Burkholderiales bacterium]
MSKPAVYRPDEAKDPRAAEVLRFWFGAPEEYGKSRKCWFKKDAAFDAHLRARFLALHEELAGGGLESWQATAPECLARIVVLDQFSRNLFRDDARAFAADPLALAAARDAIDRAIDRLLLPVERQFIYLPFEHSESLEDQRDCCALMATLKPFAETRALHDWALKHLNVIERFGRFPHRNAVLGRASTPEELEYLAQPGAGF